jgi:hypothetical protein
MCRIRIATSRRVIESDRKVCKPVIIESGLKLQRMWNRYVQKNPQVN